MENGLNTYVSFSMVRDIIKELMMLVGLESCRVKGREGVGGSVGMGDSERGIDMGGEGGVGGGGCIGE